MRRECGLVDVKLSGQRHRQFACTVWVELDDDIHVSRHSRRGVVAGCHRPGDHVPDAQAVEMSHQDPQNVELIGNGAVLAILADHPTSTPAKSATGRLTGHGRLEIRAHLVRHAGGNEDR